MTACVALDAAGAGVLPAPVRRRRGTPRRPSGEEAPVADEPVRVREAVEADVEAVRDLFAASYGDEYPFKQFYDPALSPEEAERAVLVRRSDLLLRKDIGTQQWLEQISRR